jgi:hypothetical protein
MTVSSSKGSHGKGPAKGGSTDWRTNRCFLPTWHERPKCKCQSPYIIDVWKFDDTGRASRCYFKCADLDSDFIVW